METAILAALNLAIEVLKQIPDFDERKLKELETARDALQLAIVNEDSDLLLYSKKRIEILCTTYKELFK